MWSYTPVVLGLRRLRQENCKFWASLCKPPPPQSGNKGICIHLQPALIVRAGFRCALLT